MTVVFFSINMRIQASASNLGKCVFYIATAQNKIKLVNQNGKTLNPVFQQL